MAKKVVIIALASLAISGCAPTQIAQMGMLPMCGTYPPPEYDYPYKGGPVKIIASTAAVYKYCGMGSAAQACAYGGKFHGHKECTIIVMDVYAPRTIRHEQAHCNGWPADHPGAIPGC